MVGQSGFSLGLGVVGNSILYFFVISADFLLVGCLMLA